jgi:hypothetical protein
MVMSVTDNHNMAAMTSVHPPGIRIAIEFCVSAKMLAVLSVRSQIPAIAMHFIHSTFDDNALRHRDGGNRANGKRDRIFA